MLGAEGGGAIIQRIRPSPVGGAVQNYTVIYRWVDFQLDSHHRIIATVYR